MIGKGRRRRGKREGERGQKIESAESEKKIQE